MTEPNDENDNGNDASSEELAEAQAFADALETSLAGNGTSAGSDLETAALLRSALQADAATDNAVRRAVAHAIDEAKEKQSRRFKWNFRLVVAGAALTAAVLLLWPRPLKDVAGRPVASSADEVVGRIAANEAGLATQRSAQLLNRRMAHHRLLAYRGAR